MRGILAWLFGCRHSRLSFPISTIQRDRDVQKSEQRTYVVCLDCGKEMPYDWDQMKRVQTSGTERSPVKQGKIEVRLEG